MKLWKSLTPVALCLVLLLMLLPTTANAATKGNYTYTVADGEATITDCVTSVRGDIVIPSTLGGYPVTAIGDAAFYDCTWISGVTIPDGVATIGNEAFRFCESLESVTIPASVTAIGTYAFGRCDSLVGVYISDIAAWCKIFFDGEEANPLRQAGHLYLNNTLVTDLVIPAGVTAIGDEAFSGCDDLTSVTIPDGVTTIGRSAFSGCYELKSVTIPSSVTFFGDFAFSNCEKLTDVTIPDGVTSIGKSTFSGIGVTDITIPDSVTAIGDFAFSACGNLSSIRIPGSVTTIGKSAFYYCKKLKDVYFDGNQEQWNGISKGSYNENLLEAKIHFAAQAVPGDIDGNEELDTNDAVYLLLSVMFGAEDYPVAAGTNLDYTGDGVKDTDDAVYLLLHIMFGAEDYPLAA